MSAEMAKSTDKTTTHDAATTGPATACERRQTARQERVARASGTTMVEYPVNGEILLAGQPQPQDWALLAARGFTLVVNMRSDPQRAALEAENAARAGLRSLHLPLPAYELEPSHVAEFHEVVSRAGEEKLFIHCRTATRTALLWLLHRISYDGWSQEEAEAELRAVGYTDEDMEVFTFCAEDYFERTVETELYL